MLDEQPGSPRATVKCVRGLRGSRGWGNPSARPVIARSRSGPTARCWPPGASTTRPVSRSWPPARITASATIWLRRTGSWSWSALPYNSSAQFRSSKAAGAFLFGGRFTMTLSIRQSPADFQTDLSDDSPQSAKSASKSAGDRLRPVRCRHAGRKAPPAKKQKCTQGSRQTDRLRPAASGGGPRRRARRGTALRCA